MSRLKVSTGALVLALIAVLPLNAAAQARTPTPHHAPPAAPVTRSSLNGTLASTLGTRTAPQVTADQLCSVTKPGQAGCDVEVLASRSTHRWLHPKLHREASPDRTTEGTRRLTFGSSGNPLLSLSTGGASRIAASPLYGAGSASSAEELPQAGTPAFLQQAYDLSYLSATQGAGETIGIVDAYSDPTAASDLATYRSEFGLPACTVANGCLTLDDESSNVDSSGDWDVETALDLDMVSAICPLCHIVLVEAPDAYLQDLNAAISEAKTLGATQISNSWGGGSAGDPAPGGVNVLASAGDSGYTGTPQYPAAFADFTAVGGTALTYDPTNPRGYDESAWVDSGSGCDTNQAKPAYQTGDSTGCAGRSYNDISAVGDPETGVEVYETPSGGSGGWLVVGGTSASSPITASYYALIGAENNGPAWAYQHASGLNDITAGSNADVALGDPTCPSDPGICTAGGGFDGPTGNGSISGDVVAGAPGIGSNGNGAATITGTSYSLTAGVYPNGADTTVWVQYGPTGSGYTMSTATQDIGSGTGAAGVSFTLTGLATSTDYHYRVVASNSDGTTYGYDNDILSPQNAPLISGVSVSTVTKTSATISYSGDLYGSGFYCVEFSPESGANAGSWSCSPTVRGSGDFSGSTTLSGLNTSTGYHYFLVAENSTTETYSPTEQFYTSQEVSAGSPTASSIGSASATLSGVANNEGDGTGSYYFEYGTSPSYGSRTASASIDGGSSSADGTDNAVSANLNGLTPSTTYHYALVATANGQTAITSDATFTTSPAVGVSNTSATVNDAGDATVSFAANAYGNAGTTAYVQYGPTTSYGAQSEAVDITGSSAQPESIELSGLEANTNYKFQVVVGNSLGTTAASGQFTTTRAVAQSSVSASAPDPTDASLSGEANAYGNPGTTAYFQYGTSAGMGSQTTATSVTGSGNQQVSVSLSGLIPGATYYYEFVVTNAFGTVTSPQQTLTTPSAAGAGSVSASVQDSGDATLSGNASDFGWSGSTTYFQYGTTTSYGNSTQATAITSSPVEETAAIGGLSASTTYHYRLVVTNQYGTAYSPDATFTTPSAGTLGPPNVTINDASDVTVADTFATNGNASSIYVQYGTTASYGQQSTTEFSASTGTETAALSGLQANTTYHYQVVLSNSYGTVTSPDETFGTGPAVAASGTSASNVAITSATLNGIVDPESTPDTTYYFEYGTTSGYGQQTESASISGSSGLSVSANLTGLQAGTTYHYALVASNTSGTATTSDGTFTTRPPAAATNLNVTGISTTGATLAGTASGEDVADTFACFDYGNTSSYGQEQCTELYSGASQTVSITLSGLTPATTYHYALTVSNADGSVSSEDETFTTASQQPTATDLIATAASDSSESISGTANAHGNSGEQAYFEYGPTTGYGQATESTSLSGAADTTPSATLTGLTPNTTYHYALVVGGGSAAAVVSQDGTFTTLPVATVTVGSSVTGDAEANLNANVTPYGDVGSLTAAYFEYGTTTGYGQTTSPVSLSNLGLPGSRIPQSLNASLSALQPATTYFYALVVADGSGAQTFPGGSFATAAAPGVTPPPATTTTTTSSTSPTSTAAGTSQPPVTSAPAVPQPLVTKLKMTRSSAALTVRCAGRVACTLRLQLLETVPDHLGVVLVTRTTRVAAGQTASVVLSTRHRLATRAQLTLSVAVRRNGRYVAVKA